MKLKDRSKLKELRNLAIVGAGLGALTLAAIGVCGSFGVGGGYVMQQIYRQTHAFVPLDVGAVYAQSTAPGLPVPRVGSPAYDPATGRYLGKIHSFTAQSGPEGWMPCDRDKNLVPLTVEGLKTAVVCGNGGPLTGCPYATTYLCKDGRQIIGPMEDRTYRDAETGQPVRPE